MVCGEFVSRMRIQMTPITCFNSFSSLAFFSRLNGRDICGRSLKSFESRHLTFLIFDNFKEFVVIVHK